MPHSYRKRQVMRRGTSTLELSVAMTVFSLAVIGLCPMAASYQRLGRQYDGNLTRLDSTQIDLTTHNLVPASSSWSRQNGVPAQDLSSVDRVSFVEDPSQSYKSTLDDSDTGTPGASLAPADDWPADASPDAYNGGFHTHDIGDGTQTATWTFSGLRKGCHYLVYVTWPVIDGASSQTPISVVGANEGYVEPVLDQTKAAKNDVVDLAGGRRWQKLGHTYSTSTGSLQVQINTAGDGKVVADAVRVVPYSRVSPSLTIHDETTNGIKTRTTTATVQP